MTIACLLLGISGGIRFWRDWQFAALAAESDRIPFQLSELPRTIGNWMSRAEEDGELDSKVSRVAGSRDSIVRTYLDKKNGDRASALAIYGRAEQVWPHSPDICYPVAGYQLVKGPADREMSVPGMEGKVRYRWSIYMKKVGGVAYYQEVYHSFFHNGEWLSDVADRWKSFRYHPAMFRILLDRPVSVPSDEVYGPTEELLGELAREISDRMSHSEVGKTVETKPVSTSPALDPQKLP